MHPFSLPKLTEASKAKKNDPKISTMTMPKTMLVQNFLRYISFKGAAATGVRVVRMLTLVEFDEAHNGSHIMIIFNSILPTPKLFFLLYRQNFPRRVEFCL